VKVRRRKTGRERGYAQLRPPWKPGQSGNPAGGGSPGSYISRSIKDLVRDCLQEEDAGTAKLAKRELVEIALKKAKKGNFFFWSKLIDLHESQLVNEDDLHEFIEKVYLTVRRHVEKLDGGREALSEIARDLQKETENE
jgi:hypothetical protein